MIIATQIHLVNYYNSAKAINTTQVELQMILVSNIQTLQASIITQEVVTFNKTQIRPIEAIGITITAETCTIIIQARVDMILDKTFTLHTITYQGKTQTTVDENQISLYYI